MTYKTAINLFLFTALLYFGLELYIKGNGVPERTQAYAAAKR